jgi:class 3 adenylate cyclase/tetratricopeptide (TPR) repeat protein
VRVSACPSCGTEGSADARFCGACGARLAVICPGCGVEQPVDAAFCSRCGTALSADAGTGGAPAERDERRVVTVLFADLTGSTALGEQLDPEDVRALQQELFEIVNGQVETHGGVTEKFAGDAILAVFGIPQTHEDDADRAVRAGLAILGEFPEFSRRVRERHEGEVGVRIGVNTGEVVSGREAAARGEMMVSGDAVNVAARLQQLAPPGGLLVGERTYQATHRSVDYEDAGSLAAKGKAQPIRAWQALRATTPPGSRPHSHSLALIGRDDELALLRLLASRVRRERMPQLVTLFGQAGVGKSRLIAEFVTGLDATVVTGRCVPYGDGITYLPLVEVSSALAALRDDDPSELVLEKLRIAVGGVVPDDQASQVLDALAWTHGIALPGRGAGIASGGNVRLVIHDAWVRYLAALGRDSMLVLVIEDVHWASDPLFELLDHLVDALESTAVLIVCSSRPELVATRPSWGGGRLNVSSLTLTPLDRPNAERLLQSLLGADVVPDHIAQAVLAPAEGNPFFVEEMLAMLVDQGALERRNGGWVATGRLDDAHVPDSIHGVIAARIDLLEAEERDALRRCSVMGRVFWPSAVGVDEQLIAGLVRSTLVSEQGESALSGRREFIFKHALTHEVAYATLPRGERRDLHRRVAEWIRDAVPDRHAEIAELVAYHYEQALAHGRPESELADQTFAALLAAGDAALQRGEYVSGERLLERALELAPDEPRGARALLLAASAAVQTSRYQQALEYVAEVVASADRSGDTLLAGDALGWKARASWLHGDWRTALEAAQEATSRLDGLPESDELARALSRLSQIEMLRALPTAEATARRAIEVARRVGEGQAEANARINLFTVRSAWGVVPQEAELREIIDLAERSGAPDEGVRAVVNFLWAASILGPLDDAERIVHDALQDTAHGLGAQSYEQYLQLSLALLVYVPSGRWLEADAVVGVDKPAAVTNRLLWLTIVSGLAVRRGDVETADLHLPELRSIALASEEPQRIVPMASVAIPRALLAGDLDAVRELADVVLGLEMQAINWSPSTLAVARALTAAGERDRLSRLYDPAPPDGAPRTTFDAVEGLVALLDGELDDAVRLLGTAEESMRGEGRAFDAACITLELASALDRGGDAADAQAARARAAAVLEPIGCVNPF